MNDILSQQTADKVLGGIRDHITKSLDERFGLGQAARITTSHNKITVGLAPNINAPLPRQHEIDAIVQRAIAEQRHIIEESASRLGKTPADIKKAFGELKVTAGEAQVPRTGDDFAKLEAAYDSEISARGGTVGPERITRMKVIQKLKNDIIRDFREVKFSHGKNQYPAVILDISGNPRLHPLIGDTIRKPGGLEYIKPIELGQRVDKYLSSLNQELDYVPPAVHFDEALRDARDIDLAFRIDTETGTGSVSRNALERTYKGSLSKAAFFKAIEGKTGVCVMVDVKAMFGRNTAALDRISQTIAETGADVAPIQRLDAVGNVTRGFIRGTRGIDRGHPDILSTHGGDEYMYFVEGATPADIANITHQARSAVGNQGFDIRVSARHTVASREVFDALDGETKVAKAIENMGRTRTGESASFLRHVEVSVESFAPDHIVNELTRRREAIERTLRHLGT